MKRPVKSSKYSYHSTAWGRPAPHLAVARSNPEDDDYDDEYDDDTDDDYERVINEAHGGREPYEPIDSEWVRRQPKPLWFGVELEVDAKYENQREERAQQVIDSIGPKYGDVLLYDIQEDGSLGPAGFEIITQPAGLDVHREQWLKADLKGLRGHDVRGHGLHIHFTKAAMKKVDGKYPAVGRMIVFINSDANKTFMETFARRSFIQWAQRESHVSIAEGARRRSDKFVALNTSPSRTFEFRLPRSTTKVTTILATLEFLYLLIRFCEEASNAGLTVENYKKFVAEPRWAKETLFLRAYLVDRGLATAQEMKLPKKKPENLGSGGMIPVGSGSGPVRSNPGRSRAVQGTGKRRDEDYYARWAVKEYRRTRKQED